MNKLTSIRIKQNDGTYSDDIPVQVLADNVVWTEGSTVSLTDILGQVKYTTKGSIQHQLDTFSLDEVENARVGADDTQYQNLKARLDGEYEDLQDAIAAVAANLQTQTGARSNADTAIRTDLSSETTSRINGDNLLSGQITSEVAARQAAMNSEVTARNNAISSAIASEVTNRNSAITAETTARQTAINNEASARQTADTTLQNNINNEVSARQTADNNLQTQINQIVAPSGEAPSAAEVQNARIGADGVTYATLGEAIRTNDAALRNLLNGAKSATDSWVVNNKWVHSTIDNSGQYVESNNFICSLPIYNVHNNLFINMGSFAFQGAGCLAYIRGFDAVTGAFTTYLKDKDLTGYNSAIPIQDYINMDFNASVCWVLFRKVNNGSALPITAAEYALADKNIVITKKQTEETVSLTSKISSYYHETTIFHTRQANNDWLYITDSAYKIPADATSVTFDFYSMVAGTAKIYLINYALWKVLKLVSVTTVVGQNTVTVDVSDCYCDMVAGYYSQTKGAFTIQSKIGGNEIEFPWSAIYGWYVSPSGVSEGSTISPSRWTGNLTTNKQYPCVRVYVQSPIPARRASVIHVDKNGGGDFTTINDALRNAGDIVNHSTTIIIHPGEYNEVVYLEPDNHIALVGTDRDKCIIYQVGGRYEQQPVAIQGEGSVANLTLKMLVDGSFTPTYTENVMATYGGYALHIDGRQTDLTKEITKRVSNCTLYSEAFPAVGAGCNQNQNIVIENSDLIRNCTIADFKRDLWKGAIIMHASNYPSDVNCNWMLKDCIVKSNYGVAGQIISRTGMAQTEFTTIAINNTFYSEESGVNSFEYTQGDSNLSPMSHGNTVTALNYQNT